MPGHDPELISRIEQIAQRARVDTIEMICRAGSGHPGGSLSCAEILACLIFHQARLDPKEPRRRDRDRIVLSKGHAAPMLYALLAERGFFDRSHLQTLRQIDSMLQGHPDMRKTPGVDMTTGSLGQGLSAAAGMALGARLHGRDFTPKACKPTEVYPPFGGSRSPRAVHRTARPPRVFAILGDGETNEGQVWEAALFAAHHKLGNLIAIVDHNDLQLDGPCAEVMCHDPLPEKWAAFGWQVLMAQGHCVSDFLDKLDEAVAHNGAPAVIIAQTVKGKGVSFMENRYEWHGRTVTPQERDRALAELRGTR